MTSNAFMEQLLYYGGNKLFCGNSFGRFSAQNILIEFVLGYKKKM